MPKQTLVITASLITVGNAVIQLRNVAQASIWQKRISKSGAGLMAVVGIVAIGISLFAEAPQLDVALRWALGIAGCCLFSWGMVPRTVYMLYLQTNAGAITPVASRDRKFVEEILRAIQVAMSRPDGNTHFEFKVDSRNINNNITGSTIGQMVGGDVQRS